MYLFRLDVMHEKRRVVQIYLQCIQVLESVSIISLLIICDFSDDVSGSGYQPGLASSAAMH
jgi:hypothetical protein